MNVFFSLFLRSTVLTTGTKVVEFKHCLMLFLIPWISMPRAALSHSQSSILKRSTPVCSVISTALCISDMSLKCSGHCDLTYFLEWLLPHQNRLTLVTCLVLLAHRNSNRNKVAAKCLSLFRGLKWHSHFLKSIHRYRADLSQKKQNTSTINTIYRFKDTLVKLLMGNAHKQFWFSSFRGLKLPMCQAIYACQW